MLFFFKNVLASRSGKGHSLLHFSFNREALKRGASSMVEQLPFKQLVRGSNPRRPTTSKQPVSLINKGFAGFFLKCCPFPQEREFTLVLRLFPGGTQLP